MISLCCPTRGRPENVRRFVASAYRTASEPRNVEIIFYRDDDDPSAAIDVVGVTPEGGRVAIVHGPRILLSECWNRCADEAEGEILGHMGDDIVFRSRGWDREVHDAFEAVPDRICFVHGRDGYHDARFGTHGFVHRRWVETLGYLCPPFFSSDWNDQWLNDLANELGRRVYLEGVYTEHCHPDFAKAALDQTYLERIERGKRDNVMELYYSLGGKRLTDIAKLRRVMA